MNRLAVQATQQFKIEAPKAFAEYYRAPITPICGDYLSSIAMAKLNKLKETSLATMNELSTTSQPFVPNF